MTNTIKFRLKDILGRGKSGVHLEMSKIDDFFYSKKQTSFTSKTDSNGYCNMRSIPRGSYLVKIQSKKTMIEKVVNIDSDKTIEIKMPVFEFFGKSEEIENKEIERIYDENRGDLDRCFKCKTKYKTYSDRFKCSYCNKFFCPKHRLPENHGCRGELRSKTRAFREVHSSNGSIRASV